MAGTVMVPSVLEGRAILIDTVSIDCAVYAEYVSARVQLDQITPRGVARRVDTVSGPSVLEIFGAIATDAYPSPVGRMPPSRE